VQLLLAIGNVGDDDGQDGGEGQAEWGCCRKGVEIGAGVEELARWFLLQPSLILPPAGGGKGRVEFLRQQPGESGDDSHICVFQAVIIEPDYTDNSSRSSVDNKYDNFWYQCVEAPHQHPCPQHPDSLRCSEGILREALATCHVWMPSGTMAVFHRNRQNSTG